MTTAHQIEEYLALLEEAKKAPERKFYIIAWDIQITWSKDRHVLEAPVALLKKALKDMKEAV